MVIDGTTTMVCGSCVIVWIDVHSGTSLRCNASKRAATSASDTARAYSFFRCLMSSTSLPRSL